MDPSIENNFYENIVNTVREPLLILDKHLRIVKASRSFFDFFKVSPDKTIGKLIYDLGDHQWDIPKLRELLETILPEKTVFDNFEVKHHFLNIGKRIMLLNARQIETAFGKDKIILLAIEDVTARKQDEKSLREKNQLTSEYLEILLDHAHAPIIIWDSSLHINKFNHEFEKLSGYDSSEIIDKPIEILFPADKVTSTLELLMNNLNNNNSETIELDIVTKDNNIKTVLWNFTSILNKEDRNFIATIAQDITTHKQMEKSLGLLESRYRRLFETAKDGILILDAETGRIIDVNPFLCDLLAYPKEKFIDKELWQIGFFKDIATNKEKFLELQKKKYVRYDNLPLQTADSREINVEFVSNVYFADNQKVIQCNIRDVTEYKNAENNLRNSENRLRTLVQTIPDLIWLKDVDGKYLLCNTRFERFFGAKEVDIVGKTDYDFVDNKLADLFRENDRKSMAAGKPTINEELITFADDGHNEYLETIKAPYYDVNNNIVGTLGIGRDITKRKQAELELLKLSRAIEQSPVSIIITDTDGNIEYINPKVTEITGYQLAEVIGKNPRILNSGEKLKSDYKELWETITSGKEWRGEFHNKKKNGELFWESASISPIINGKGITTHYLAVKEDITEKKKIRSELLISEERYKAIFNTSLELVYIFDLEGKILEVNAQILNLFGYTLEESKSLKIFDIIAPGDLQTAYKNIEYVIANGVNQGLQEYRIRTKNEKEIIIETTAVRLDRDGKPYAIMGIARNITERKHIENQLIKAKEKAEQMNRLKTNFLANMSHELKTPLVGILGYAEFLENELTENEFREMAKIIKSSGERLNKTLNNILDISKIETNNQQINIKEHDLIKYLTEQIELFRVTAERKGLSLNFETKEEILNSYIDEEMFVSIINNILENAIKFTNTGGVTLIAKREKDYAIIEIIDTGIGVHKDHYDLIFESFRQASEGYGRSYEGTGLGLTLVKKYMDLMRGTIAVSSNPSVGSTFILKFPTNKITTEVLINTSWI